MNRRGALTLLAGAVLNSGCSPTKEALQPSSSSEHTAWVGSVLKGMERIKAGMTRADLLRVFTTEGGLSTGLGRTYVSQACPYFKVNVTFRAVGRPDRDRDGRVTLTEDSGDVVESISRPYLAFSVMD